MSSLKRCNNVTKLETAGMFQNQLIERCKKNDRKAQMQLYKSYCDAMYCVALQYVKDVNDAEDVLQEAFIKAFKNLHQFKAEVTFGAWLKRIVINKSIDFLKKKRQLLVSIDEGYLQIADNEDWNVEQEVTLQEVVQAIEQLPEKYKYVVMLYLLEGYDHSEIAQILSISENMSRTHLFRGKKKLKEILKKTYHGTRP